jgi:hypothetical protein
VTARSSTRATTRRKSFDGHQLQPPWDDIHLDILGGATGLLYATGYRDVDGILIPATRRGYAWQGDYQRVPEPLLVAIDMGEITIR